MLLNFIWELKILMSINGSNIPTGPHLEKLIVIQLLISVQNFY